MNEKSLFQLVLSYEQQGVNRAALQQLIAPEIKAIDERRKATRELIEKEVKSVTAEDAVKVVNAICPSIPGADNSARQRLSRRRNWLKSVCTKVHVTYDFSLVDGQLFAEYIGNAYVREAKTILAGLEKILSLDLPLGCTVSELSAALLGNANASRTEVVEIDDTTVTAIDSVLSRVTGIASRLNQGVTNKDANQADQVATN